MIRYRFAIGVAGILGLGAIIASTKVLGEAGKGKKEQDLRSTGLMQPIHQDRQFEMKFSECRFTGHPLITYKTQKDETYFALQLQPKLQANARMPRDILLLVDSSASQAAAPLEMSRKVAALFADNLQADDRLSIMTISNDSKQISRGFRKKDDAIASVKELAKEYASGGTNLKKGISDAINSFESIAGRQRALVFMGDGMSIVGPIDGADRAGLCKEMTSKEVVFFPVPIGSRLDPSNLHGLASGTGGLCMRLLPGDWVEDLYKRLQAAMEVPVLYSAALQLPKEVSEVYPSKLPPLRSDSPTLVVGKLEAGKTLEYKLEGKQLGKEVSLSVSEAIPVSEPENYFLLQVVQQWKNVKEMPALIQADRALAFAAEQNQVAVSDLKEKAEWALREDKFDAASRLFNQALEIDPQDGEAKNGSKMVQKLRDGKLTLEQIRKEVQPTKGETIVRIGAQGKKIRVPVAQVPVDKDAPEKPVLPTPIVGINEGDLIKETEARRVVADQQATQTVDEVIRNANRLVTRDPDGAYEMLKRMLDTTQTNPDLSPKGQSNLVGRIERALQGVKREGRRVKSDQDERLQLLANADARSAQTKMVVNQQERVSERMRVFHNLMNQARELEASRQANTIRQDLVNLGLPVPQAVNAAYTVGQRGFYLREMRDLQRVRDDKWLATLYEVERSHIPYPDEPEIVFPDAAYYARRNGGIAGIKDWADFSEKRKARYGTSTFGDDVPLPRTIELKNTLLKQVRYAGLKDGDFKLSEVLEFLSRVYNLEFDINEKAFAADGVMDVNSQIVASADKPLPPVNGSISTVLKKILGRIPAGSTATFLVRRESIEITTGAAALAEKVVRIYPVADLVYPPPSAYNQQVGLQQATLYGQAGSFGLQQQAVQNQGFNNAIMAGGIGAIGGGGGGQGALGGLGGGLGGGGMLGGNAGLGLGGGMAMAGNGGNFGQNGAVGQQGQMGNSGSQFGQQGGNSSDVLITIIRNVVGNGDKDWATAIAAPGAAAADPLADPAAGPDKNQIGFYSTANALVIKGTSRVHTNAYAPVINIGGAAAGMGALDKPKDGKIIVENKLDKNGKLIVAVPKLDPAKLKIDPQAYWQEALEKAGDNPSMIIAISDFLAMNRYFDHAADFLKANIRKGIVVKPWVYEALAIALRESGGSPAEIERAEVAAIDLEPTDGHGFLKAANTMAEMKRYTMALAFCKQAAHLEPNTSAPFEAAIKFAELADDTKAMDWAASNLMKQDWPADNKDLQELARIKSEALARKLKQSGNDQAPNATASIKEKGRRDLVIKLAWQGDADLDLQVKEPVGSICNPTNTQTVGGGVFLGDSLIEAGLETYTAAEAFKGNYEIRVKKVWGKTLGDKAQVRVIHNQGTAQQHEDIFSIDLTKNNPLMVKVDEGRRTELAYVSPPSLRPTSRSEKIRMVSKDVATQLRDIADPEITGFQRGTSIASGAIPIEMEAPAPNKNEGNDKILYQTRVQSFMKNAMDMTTQVVLSSDRRSMRVSVTPVFESTANIKPGATVVNSSVIPGSN